MLTSVISEVKGLFTNAFLVAHFLPVLVVYALWMWLNDLLPGRGTLISDWTAKGASSLALDVVLRLIVIGFIALFLQAFNPMMLNIYSGQAWSPRLRRKWIALFLQQAQHDYHHYPRSDVGERYPDLDDPSAFAPTSFGNVLSSLEQHGRRAYGFSAEVFWPTLREKLPETMRNDIEKAQSTMIAWVNGSCLLAVTLLISFGFAWNQEALVQLGITLCLAWIFGLSTYFANARARAYSKVFRVALTYRLKIIEDMQITPPKTLAEEKALWSWLNAWTQSHEVYGRWRFVQPDPSKLPLPWFTNETFTYKASENSKDATPTAAASPSEAVTPSVPMKQEVRRGCLYTILPLPSLKPPKRPVAVPPSSKRPRPIPPESPPLFLGPFQWWLLLLAGVFFIMQPFVEGSRFQTLLSDLNPPQITPQRNIPAYSLFQGTLSDPPETLSEKYFLALKAIQKGESVYEKDFPVLPIKKDTYIALSGTTEWSTAVLPVRGLKVKAGDLLNLSAPLVDQVTKVTTLLTYNGIALADSSDDKVTVFLPRGDAQHLSLFQNDDGSTKVFVTRVIAK